MVDRHMKKTILILTVMAILAALSVTADTMSTDRLNYYDSTDTTLNRTLTYTYTGAGTANVSINLTPNFNFTIDDDCGVAQPGLAVCVCTSASGTAECQNVSTTVSFGISPTDFSSGEYAITTVYGNSTSGAGDAATATSPQFIKIKEDEIFHTLIEYGRGRGNYFFDSLGRTGSASQGTGYPYVPNATRFELTFLHKIFNIGHYFGLSNKDLATNATWNCIYPNNTVSRTHLDIDVARASEWDINYSLAEIEGSFERQGYISQGYDADESAVGTAFWINCSDMSYTLTGAGGDIVVDRDYFNLTYRSPEPFNLSAATTTSTMANGTQIVDITYSLSNLEIYPVEDVRLELSAPRFCTFVNVKGELYGESRDRYMFERTLMTANDVESITLTARCDLSDDGASGINSLNLSETSLVEFIPPWEINAYNPVQYIQSLKTTSSVPVDLGQNSTVVNVLDTLTLINNTVVENSDLLTIINNTVETINTTVTENNVILEGLNLTIVDLNNTINVINGTVTSVNNTLAEVHNLTLLINNTVGDNKEMLLQINNTVQVINGTVTEIKDLSVIINNSVLVLNDTVTETQQQLVIINDTLLVVNQTVGDTLNEVTILNNTLQIVNTTIHELNTSVNNVQGNITTILSNTELDVIDPSATLFTPEDVILVDTLFLDNQGNPITGASCNITLVDNTLTELLNSTMEERTYAGVPHYTYNVSNVSSLGGVNTGKFFGHIFCKDGNRAGIYKEISFEVRDQNSQTDLSSVLNKLSRMEEFDQEMVFLVTDSFGLREQARSDAISGNNEDAIEKLAKANTQLTQVAERLSLTRDQMLSASATPNAKPVNAPAGSSWSLSDMLPKADLSLWAVILILLALLVFMFKREHMHEEPYF